MGHFLLGAAAVSWMRDAETARRQEEREIQRYLNVASPVKTDGKRNIFNDILDMGNDDNAIFALFWVIGFFVFLGTWLLYGTFWGALIAAPIFTIPIAAVLLSVLFIASAIFSRREF